MIKKAFEVEVDAIYLYLCWIIQVLSTDNGNSAIEVLIKFDNDDTLLSYHQLLSVLEEEYPVHAEFFFGSEADGHDEQYNWLLRTSFEEFSEDELIKVCLIKFCYPVLLEGQRLKISKCLVPAMKEMLPSSKA